MVNETLENDHAFSIELDVIKLNDVGDRVLIEGFLGELIDVSFAEDLLEIKGLEGNLKINLKKKEIQELFNTKRVGNRRFKL
jgi:hypothetical protein